MQSRLGSEAGRHLLVVVGTAHFENLVDSDLRLVPDELERVATAFIALGYERLQSVADPDRDQLRQLFSRVREECRAEDVVVAYYTAHGARDPERFYLLTRESDPSHLDETALAAEDLARALIKGSKASQVLLILDACYAAAGAADVAQIANRLAVALGGGPGVFVVAAARPKQEAEQGALSSALARALTNSDERLGGRTQSFLAMDSVMGAVTDYLREKHPAQAAIWSSVSVEGSCRLFPNPRHRPESRSGFDLETQRAFDEHWVPKARGSELGAGGWYFTGREQVLRELSGWLREASSGGRARVVTGGPGCGKSAVLARIVTLANSKYREDVLVATGPASLDPSTLPPEGVVNVAVHARRKLLAEVVAVIGSALNLNSRDGSELVDALVRRPDKTVIVIDALDEADDKEQIVSRLLHPLMGLPHIFLLIGTRPDSSQHGRRFRALGESPVEIDLDQPQYVGVDDVGRYVERRLLAAEEPGRTTPYRGSPLIARAVAKEVSRRAGNVFLVAHTAVLRLLSNPSVVDVSQPGWIDRLPTGLDDAFAQFFSELDARRPGGLSSATARAVLLPLAFAEGEGHPWDDLWAAVACAVSGSYVGDADIALVRQHAAPFIVEASEQDRSVYRLYHERFAEHIRGSVDSRQTQRLIVQALRLRVPVDFAAQEPDWTRAHPYLLAHLASHALKAGVIGELAADGSFMAKAEPVRTLQALSSSVDPLSRRAFAGYSVAFQNLRDGCADDHISYLEMAARQVGDEALAEMWIRRRRSRPWSIPWVHWSVVSPHRIFPSSDRIRSLALGMLDGRALVFSGGEEGTVRMWHLTSGTPFGGPLCGHHGAVTSVAFGVLDDRPVVVSGGVDGTVRAWDVASGAPRGEPLRGHEGAVTSVAIGVLDEGTVIVSGGADGTLRVWVLTSGAPRGEPLRCPEGWINSVALGLLNGRPVIISGGSDSTVRMWDLASGSPRGEPLRFPEGWVTSLALGTLEGRSVIVAGGTDGTVRMWDLASGAPQGEPWRGPKGGVTSVALGTLGDRTIIAAGGDYNDSSVWLWDLVSGVEVAEPLRGHEDGVSSIVLGTFEGHSLIVSSGEDCSVRVWDIASAVLRGAPSRFTEGWVTSLALGTIEGLSVIVSGAIDGTVRVWDLASGAPRGEPLRGHVGRVGSLDVGSFDGRSIIVSGGFDGTIRVWDLASGASQGEPLRGLEGRVTSVALGAHNGRTIVVAGGDYANSRVRVPRH